MVATLKAQDEARKRLAIKIAKGMKNATGKTWHERASAACFVPEFEKLHVFSTSHTIPIEWYVKITPMGSDLVNIKVCYRLSGSMSGYNHLNNVEKLVPNPPYHHFDDLIYTLQEMAREAILAGASAVLHLLKTNEG